MSLKEILIPKENIFFELFEKQASIAVDAAKQLVDIFTDFSDIKIKYKKLKNIEHHGDMITHQAHDELNRTFITPFEPEEISRLINTMDDIVDAMDESARFLIIYNIDRIDNDLINIANCLLEATTLIAKGINYLRTLKEINELKNMIMEINHLENTVDELLANALKKLIETNDSLYIIKMKDVCEHLEEAADKCEDVADIMTGIIIRHT